MYGRNPNPPPYQAPGQVRQYGQQYQQPPQSQPIYYQPANRNPQPQRYQMPQPHYASYQMPQYPAAIKPQNPMEDRFQPMMMTQQMVYPPPQRPAAHPTNEARKRRREASISPVGAIKVSQDSSSYRQAAIVKMAAAQPAPIVNDQSQAPDPLQFDSKNPPGCFNIVQRGTAIPGINFIQSQPQLTK